MTIYVVFGLAFAFLAAAVFFYLWARRISSDRKGLSTTETLRSVSDYEGRVIWELGRKTTSEGNDPIITRRGFLPKLATSLLALIAGRAAAKGMRISEIERYFSGSEMTHHPGSVTDDQTTMSDHWDVP